jgi:hypothetical protein
MMMIDAMVKSLSPPSFKKNNNQAGCLKKVSRERLNRGAGSPPFPPGGRTIC